MTPQALAVLLVAAAVLLTPGDRVARARLHRGRGDRPGPARWLPARLRRSNPAEAEGEPLALAGAWELAAACLRAGMPMPPAVRAAARGLPGPAGRALARTAELLALGAGPEQAWQPALECPATARAARAARRSGRSGAALAGSLTALAAEVRATAREHGEARAQRAGVLITGPLGLCFLPAFLCLGVVPVVIGLAGRLLAQW